MTISQVMLGMAGAIVAIITSRVFGAWLFDLEEPRKLCLSDFVTTSTWGKTRLNTRGRRAVCVVGYCFIFDITMIALVQLGYLDKWIGDGSGSTQSAELQSR